METTQKLSPTFKALTVGMPHQSPNEPFNWSVEVKYLDGITDPVIMVVKGIDELEAETNAQYIVKALNSSYQMRQALIMAQKSLATYGNHPIIENAIDKALKSSE